MRKEIRIFFTALMFLTRLPVPQMTDHSPEYLEKAAKYFPLIGWIVGSISVLMFFLCYSFLSIELSVLASIIAGVITTGAFHEDGFADACDAFGGGWTKEKILDIMKDSRLGTFGVIGLISMLATKYLLLREITALFVSTSSTLTIVGIFLMAHALSRFMAVVAIQTSVYVFSQEKSKSKPLASRRLMTFELLSAGLFSLLPFIVLPSQYLLVIAPMLVTTFLLIRYFKKWIGGYTGDCLGAIQQATEVVCYLSIILLWKYT
ncbi:adenosylcobinamide-GDP ribazoletransferase [Chitinophagaceae bacterium LB-8]|uniref:Adenosylcobinamide-GDP ribazoletransferase n=1 Tax=Paraflavisolibacter caeni TaxID=2982496 RepID=A0A9X2XPM8_9BACT|nr:adenosylcobinamide-GDP ribazoletransferase [Paraflavisolibacter caeni]MCU7551728.1 adenosylcobinamide-GDP ribazoletransferase [Paraflavisolibacter caeni]